MSTEVAKGTTGLEVWRVLVGLYDPNNDNTRMDESTFLMSPGKAKSMSEVPAIMSKWEDVLNHRSCTLGRAPLDEDLKKSVLLSMLPDTENKELRNQRVLYRTFEALRVRVLEMVHERSAGRAPMIFNCEQYDDEENEDWQQEGEWLFRIEAKDGKKEKVCQKAPFRAKGGGKGSDRECYRCGRTGHIRAACKAKAHVNGGAPK